MGKKHFKKLSASEAEELKGFVIESYSGDFEELEPGNYHGYKGGYEISFNNGFRLLSDIGIRGVVTILAIVHPDQRHVTIVY